MSTTQTATSALEARIRAVLKAIGTPCEYIFTNVHYARLEFKPTVVINSKTIDHILDQFERPARIWNISRVGDKTSISFIEDA